MLRSYGRVFCLFVTLGCPSTVLPATLRSITATPGSLVRWRAPGTSRCWMKGRVWTALNETCFYPIDLLQKPGVISVARWVRGARQYARISVEPFDYGVEEIELPDIPQAHPSPADLRRVAREELIESRIWLRREGPARFSLPLGPPAKPFPEGKAFGVKRVYNGKPAPQPHTGIDCPVPVGSPVMAVADGSVVLARNFFYPGNGVFIDHGNGLVSVYFHLAEIDVREGEIVRKGHRLGTVGSTGRATGPHLFFAVRWHGARIDPSLLFGDAERVLEISS